MEEGISKVIEWVETDDNKSTTITVTSDSFNANVLTVERDGYQQHLVIASSINGKFMDVITGQWAEEALNLLTIAVNNRTRERDYFRLYCDMLDGSITEEDFDREIEQHPEEYIVDESSTPSQCTVGLALRLAENIKSVSGIDDLNSLFSFDPNAVNSLIRVNDND